MKLSRHILTIAALSCAMVFSSTTLAQGPRGNNGRNPQHNSQPGGNQGNRNPGGNNTGRPGNSNPKPGNNAPRPGNSNPKPGNAPGRPGNNNPKPGGNMGNPGGHKPAPGPAPKPGTPHPGPGAVAPHPGPGPGPAHPGTPRYGSLYRPGAPRPHVNFRSPGYRPPRHNGGYWGPPPVNIYRPSFYVPAPPPRATIRYGIPSIGSILGLTFGTFIDTGINYLFNAGYNVLGYANNMVYLGNVNQLGYLWPEATIYYSDGLMSDTQFQYWTTYPSSNRFNSVYSLLVNNYGPPVNSVTSNGVTTASWWAGGGTGFITLQYGPGTNGSGQLNYYTSLTYSDYQ